MPVPPHVFALAPDRLDYACCERGAGGFRLEAHRSVELPPGSFTEGLLGGPLKDPAAFRDGLGSFVASLDEPVKAASLVVPDAWLRLAFAEAGELPDAGSAREDVLRWKLKRLVPFRVEDLRVQGVEVSLPAAGPEGRRLLLAFALEGLLAQIESAFAAAGVALGQISNVSLSLLGALPPPPDGALQGLVVVAEDGAYSLVFGQDEEPFLHRYKASGRELAGAARSSLVERDLRLTRNFLDQQLGGVPLARVVLAAAPADEPAWLTWLAAGLAGEGEPPAVEPLSVHHLPPVEGLDGLPLTELAPLVAAANREVA